MAHHVHVAVEACGVEYVLQPIVGERDHAAHAALPAAERARLRQLCAAHPNPSPSPNPNPNREP